MRALVVGRSSKVWDEVRIAKELGKYDFTVVINDTGADYPEAFEHWVTFHVLNLDQWVAKRRAKGLPEPKHYWTSKSQMIIRQGCKLADLEGLDCEDGGASGMLGVMCARQHGATRIVLAGIPMQEDHGHYNQVGPWTEANGYQSHWRLKKAELFLFVRSMSGWTMEQFGEPTSEWLNDPSYSAVPG